MDGLGPVLMGLLVVSCWAAPVILAKLLADTLDGAPYLIALSVGIAVGAVRCAALWTVVRGALASFGSARPGATAIVLAIATCPTWTIGIAVGINRALDRSPLVAHECRVLEWQRPAKGRARCLVTSWREHATEVLSDAVVQPGAPDGAAPSPCTPGQTLVVSTRAGRLG